MKLSLVHYMTYRTKLSATEVEKRLAQETEPEKLFRTTGFFFDKESKAYEGEIADGAFKIMPIIRGRNSFIPIIYGEIEQKMGATLIYIKMRVHWALFIALGFWPGLGLLLFLTVQMDNASNISDGHVFLIGPFTIGAIMYLLFCLFFWIGIKPYKKALAELWEASLE